MAKVMLSVMCVCLSVHGGGRMYRVSVPVPLCTGPWPSVQDSSTGITPPRKMPQPQPPVHAYLGPHCTGPPGLAGLVHVVRTVGKQAVRIRLKCLVIVNTFAKFMHLLHNMTYIKLSLKLYCNSQGFWCTARLYVCCCANLLLVLKIMTKYKL